MDSRFPNIADRLRVERLLRRFVHFAQRRLVRRGNTAA
jgi:hypothetical protein